ncbi:MAG: flagellar hook-length control protein FliK [Lachnospiraceae bacterium]|nr:flagellar hook-length control protein FliK [Lachnospiraceae bacterium]
MTTTETTVKNAFFNAKPAAKPTADTKKTDDQTKAQSFGDVLGKTAQKFEAPKQTTQAITTTEKPKTQQPDKKNFEESQKDTTVKNTAEKTATVKEKADTAAESLENGTEHVTETTQAEESGDEMTIDEIANAIEQIMGQIKEILGITDEELLSGMEALEMQPCDLLNIDNMAQLVTAISGEDSALSLIADEGLYAALQEITEMVGVQVENLLENTGLSGSELEAVLQKLQELESRNLESQVQEAEILPADELNDDVAEAEDGQELGEPLVIVDDNTKSSDKAAKQNDALPENQQEHTAEPANQQTQNISRESKESDGKESKEFGQHGSAQNFQNNMNEISNTAAAEGIEKFTSESTESIMRQIADMVKIVKNENLTEMELQLHPASLGTVNVSLTTKGGVVTAEFTTQNEAVKAAIEAQASQLRANLEEQGVKIEAIEVSVESHQMERNLDKNGQEQQRQAQEQEAQRIQGVRRRSSINLRAFADGEELEGEMQGADDATRIAMEIMAANGNTMDLLA